jgi:hypothetical protein
MEVLQLARVTPGVSVHGTDFFQHNVGAVVHQILSGKYNCNSARRFIKLGEKKLKTEKK